MFSEYNSYRNNKNLIEEELNSYVPSWYKYIEYLKFEHLRK